jgi:hypothetical protein
VTLPDGRALRVVAIGLLTAAVASDCLVHAQTATQGAAAVPSNATALEGLPTVRIETTSESVTRRQLAPTEARANRLRIQIKDGSFYWSSRDDERLALRSAGEFTYLTSNEPGQYVRIRRVNDKLTYVEHVETALGIVTYWGELQIVLGK